MSQKGTYYNLLYLYYEGTNPPCIETFKNESIGRPRG